MKTEKIIIQYDNGVTFSTDSYEQAVNELMCKMRIEHNTALRRVEDGKVRLSDNLVAMAQSVLEEMDLS